MTNFVTAIRKAHNAYEQTYDRFYARIKRGMSQYTALANAALNRELTRRFKRGYWCIAWSHCTMGGEITPALDLTDDLENAVSLRIAKGDAKLFPKIDYFTYWDLHWYLLKQQDILIAHDDAPEQLHLVEKFFTEKNYQLYKKCL